MREIFSTLVNEDSDGIYHNIPNARYGKWKINSLGFIGEEIDLEKKEGEFRIICLGASETFGASESKNWPSQLREMLRNQVPRVEVINASVVRLDLKKKKDYVEKYVLPLRPDIMIIFQGFIISCFSTDRKDWTREGEKKRLVNYKREKNPLKGFLSHVRVLQKFEETIKGFLPKPFVTHLNMWMLRRKIRRKEKKYLINKKPVDEVPKNIILEFERDLKSFVLYLKEKNIVTVLSTYPALITPANKDIHKNLLLDNRRFMIELSEKGVVDAPNKFNQAIQRISEELNLTFIDNNYLIPKTLEYFKDNFHYTDKGAEFIAKTFYNVLNHYEFIK
jgi:lysophospholipase L1-like esterase